MGSWLLGLAYRLLREPTPRFSYVTAAADRIRLLVGEIRGSRGATERFDQAVADTLGMNRTDLRLIDLLDREGRLSAGELAEGNGLTTGAITTAIDRLEQAGFARRVRDSADRRRVYVEVNPEAGARIGALYSEHARRAENLYRRCTEEQLEFFTQVLGAAGRPCGRRENGMGLPLP